jgi:hypothetical protein
VFGLGLVNNPARYRSQSFLMFTGTGVRVNKKDLSERDICSKYITPAIQRAGWDILTQVREEVSFTKGRIIVRGKLVTRSKGKRADYILSHKANIPLALIKAKDNNHGDGMQQALEYADTLSIPFVFTSNGDAFLFHDRTGSGDEIGTELTLSDFPTLQELWSRYRAWKGLGLSRIPSSFKINFMMVLARNRVTISVSPSIELSKRLPKSRIAFFSLWPSVQARPIPRSRSYGGSGRPGEKSEYSSSQIGMS